MKLRYRIRSLLLIVTITGAALGLVFREYVRARGEQTAYWELRRFGATGDDWVGSREFLFGREYAPIVQIELPPTLPLRVAMPHLRQLDNLDLLDLSGNLITDQDLSQLKDLRTIHALRLSSTRITDGGVPHLATLQHLRWLHLDGTQITEAGLTRLQDALPNCTISR